MQTTSHILMIRPANFLFNRETAVNNAFQVEQNDPAVQQKAITEFDNFVDMLRSKKIDVTVINDTADPHTPDSIFPNNWVSFHDDGSMVLYPMFARNRRLERKPGVIEQVKSRFNINKVLDLSKYEDEEKYLEGTGSIVLDRDKRIAYACLSPRTDKNLFYEYCQQMSYTPIPFHAVDKKGAAIYHTNVMMCVADRYVVICVESIRDEKEREGVIKAITASEKETVEITLEQMVRFAGNMLQVNNDEGRKFLVMSTQAFNSLNNSQVKTLEAFNEIIHSPLNTIEATGGGSARCMMAEVHLEPLSVAK